MIDEYLTSKNCHHCARRDYAQLENGDSDGKFVQRTMVPMHYPNKPPVSKKRKKKKKENQSNSQDLSNSTELPEQEPVKEPEKEAAKEQTKGHN